MKINGEKMVTYLVLLIFFILLFLLLLLFVPVFLFVTGHLHAQRSLFFSEHPPLCQAFHHLKEFLTVVLEKIICDG
jgi:hypothetical protein